MTTESLPVKRKNTPTGAIILLRWLSRYGILVALIVLGMIFAVLSQQVHGEQYFLRQNNILQIALQGAINAIIAVGMTYVITSGGIDLSVGSVVALVGILVGQSLKADTSPIVALLLGIGVGVVCGSINGLLITRANLPPFIATLGTMGIFRGVALIISDGRPIYGLPQSFIQLYAGQLGPFQLPLIGQLGPIPIPVIIAFVVAVVFAFVLTRTRIGEYTIAIGGNEETARLSGINVKLYKLMVYAICGGLSGLAGVVLTARMSAAEPIAGASFELDAIAATVMGGTSLMGGEGTIWGTIIGALFTSLVRNGMNILNVQAYWQQVVIGTIIILAVIIDRLRKR
jgi:ribose/xylose/arabinose/galactoside ABC-type transport system permease subunit